MPKWSLLQMVMLWITCSKKEGENLLFFYYNTPQKLAF